MCLILFAVNPNSRYRLIVAANRDELYARPTRTANFWNAHPNLLAGQDEDMGGTWLGVNKHGDFAAVTNFNETPLYPLPPRSRGELVADFLTQETNPNAFVQIARSKKEAYKGFNLIVANQDSCFYYGNRAGAPEPLSKGFYGLSNQTLNCDWPKVTKGREKLTQIVETLDNPIEALFNLLLDHGDGENFSSSFIVGETYGTRAATVVLMKPNGNVLFEERNFGASGTPLTENRFQFNCNDDP